MIVEAATLIAVPLVKIALAVVGFGFRLSYSGSQKQGLPLQALLSRQRRPETPCIVDRRQLHADFDRVVSHPPLTSSVPQTVRSRNPPLLERSELLIVSFLGNSL